MYYVMVLNIFELLVKDKHTSSKCSHEQLRYILRKLFFHIDNEFTLYKKYQVNLSFIHYVYVIKNILQNHDMGIDVVLLLK